MDWAAKWERLDTADTHQRRERMVARQLESRGVKESRVLDAMRTLPRHLFLPSDRATAAYEDTPVDIGWGQTISQPYMVAAMTELLEPSDGSRVLEIGTGSGYQAAVLAMLSAHVYTVERIDALLDMARTRFDELGLSNITAACDDGSEGWFEHAPYDRIVVTAAPRDVPPLLPKQLVDGGKMVIPAGERDVQTLLKIERVGSEYRRSEHGGCVFVPLYGKDGWDFGSV